MSSIVQCDKCGNIMFGSNGGDNTLYKCPKCGYNYQTGLRFNKLTEQYVKYIKMP